MFTLTINTDNAAFAIDPGAEIARILHTVGDRLINGNTAGGNVCDINGNTVGEWEIS